MQYTKWIAIGLCIAFVLGAYAVWNFASAGFNPNPVTTSIVVTSQSCSTSGACGAFRIDSANLSVHDMEDYTSQSLSLQLSDVGAPAMSSVAVYFGASQGDVYLGKVVGPFVPNSSKVVSLDIPTTISVNQGTTYTVLVEGFFGSQESSGYFQSVEVVAQ